MVTCEPAVFAASTALIAKGAPRVMIVSMSLSCWSFAVIVDSTLAMSVPVT